jgi:hypothetical protein
MGEKQNQPFQFLFHASLKFDSQGSRVTSDGGLILIRELDGRLGLKTLIEEHLSNSRQGLNKQFTLADLLRQSVYSRLAGYEALKDAERLAADPTFRLISSQRIWDRGAALTSTLHWFETALLTRPVGRPSHKPVVWYNGLLYQAASWKTARRVVAKVEFHFGELFPRVGFIVTNLSLPRRAVVRFYNQRGTGKQRIKEGKQATHWIRLSCHRFRANEVRLQLSLLAYNLGNLWRQLVLPKRIDTWSLTSLQQRLVKTGRATDQPRPLLLAPAGREPPNAAAVWEHAGKDRGTSISNRIDGASTERDFSAERDWKRKLVFSRSGRKGSAPKNLAGALHNEGGGCTLSVEKSKWESQITYEEMK